VTPIQYVVIGAAVLFAACIQTITGFGFSLFAVPIMSMAIPTESAVIIAATLSTFTSGGQAYSERHHGDRRSIVRLLAAAVVGLPFGLAILIVTTSQQLKIALVVVILLFLVVNLRGITLDRAGTAVEIGFGFLAGVLSTSLSTNGPPLVMALHPRHLPPPKFRATIAMVLVALGSLSLVLFAISGRFHIDIMIALLVALPTMFLGFFAGHRFRGRIEPTGFRRLVTLLLILTALTTMLSVFIG